MKFSVLGRNSARVYNIPYSEHSSFDELQECVRYLKPKKIIPTVNADTSQQIKSVLTSLKPKAKQTLLPFDTPRKSPTDDRENRLSCLIEGIAHEHIEQEQSSSLSQMSEDSFSLPHQMINAGTEKEVGYPSQSKHDGEQAFGETAERQESVPASCVSKYFASRHQDTHANKQQPEIIELDLDSDTSCNTSTEKGFGVVEEASSVQGWCIDLSDTDESDRDLMDNKMDVRRTENGERDVETQTGAKELSPEVPLSGILPFGGSPSMENLDDAAMNFACRQYINVRKVDGKSQCQSKCVDKATVAKVIEEQELILRQIQDTRRRPSLSSPVQPAAKRSKSIPDVRASSCEHHTLHGSRGLISTYSIDPSNKTPKKMVQTRLSFDGRIQAK